MVQHSITIVFDGELDTHHWEAFRDTIVDAATDGITAVILDLGAVEFFDSSAVRGLLQARAKLAPQGVTLYLGVCSPIVDRVVEITGIGQAFPSWSPGDR